MENKLNAIMEALEVLLEEKGKTQEARSLYEVRSGYNPEEE